MPRLKINKSAKIREAFESLGAGARPKDVIATLAKKRIKVSPAQVSNIKARIGTGPGNEPGRKVDSSDRVSLSSLISAKRFIEQIGGLEKAQDVLSALAKLQ